MKKHNRLADIIAFPGSPKAKRRAATPPPSNRTPKRTAADNAPKKQWVFAATFDDLPGVMNVTVAAPNEREAWGIAYLITERFSMGAIQWLKAKPEGKK